MRTAPATHEKPGEFRLILLTNTDGEVRSRPFGSLVFSLFSDRVTFLIQRGRAATAKEAMVPSWSQAGPSQTGAWIVAALSFVALRNSLAFPELNFPRRGRAFHRRVRVGGNLDMVNVYGPVKLGLGCRDDLWSSFYGAMVHEPIGTYGGVRSEAAARLWPCHETSDLSCRTAAAALNSSLSLTISYLRGSEETIPAVSRGAAGGDRGAHS